jgi:hypothetical protein
MWISSLTILVGAAFFSLHGVARRRSVERDADESPWLEFLQGIQSLVDEDALDPGSHDDHGGQGVSLVGQDEEGLVVRGPAVIQEELFLGFEGRFLDIGGHDVLDADIDLSVRALETQVSVEDSETLTRTLVERVRVVGALVPGEIDLIFVFEKCKEGSHDEPHVTLLPVDVHEVIRVGLLACRTKVLRLVFHYSG